MATEGENYKIIKLGGEMFAIIKVVGSQAYTVSKHRSREDAYKALAKINETGKQQRESRMVDAAITTTNARFAPTSDMNEGKSKDTLEANVRRLARLGPKVGKDKRKGRRYNRIMKRVRNQMQTEDNRRVDAGTFKPQNTHSKSKVPDEQRESEKNASKEFWKAKNDPNREIDPNNTEYAYKERKQKEADERRKAAGGLAELLKKKKEGLK